MSQSAPAKPRKAAPSRPAASKGRNVEDRYRALLEQLPIGVYRTTADGLIVEAVGGRAVNADGKLFEEGPIAVLDVPALGRGRPGGRGLSRLGWRGLAH